MQGAPAIRRGPGASPWVLRPQPNPSAVLRLFCLPYAGGDTWIYHDWHRFLPDYVEVCPIRLPGRGSRMADKPFSRVEELVVALGEGLRHDLDLPFAIYGHSMGALIGFELARYFRQTSSRRPTVLWAGASRAPQHLRFRPPISNLGPYVMLEVLQHRYGTFIDVGENEELLDMTLPVMRADFAMCENYRYAEGDPLDCPIVVYRGTADKTLSAPEARAWETQTSEIFRQREIKGDHFFPVGAKASLLEHLSEDLDAFIL